MLNFYNEKSHYEYENDNCEDLLKQISLNLQLKE